MLAVLCTLAVFVPCFAQTPATYVASGHLSNVALFGGGSSSSDCTSGFMNAVFSANEKGITASEGNSYNITVVVAGAGCARYPRLSI